ncbi:MAG TPA: creatininase family protein [Roseiflexaceae bacterium]|nr:creatininase family protein [Roseiflexaceae bacterium]
MLRLFETLSRTELRELASTALVLLPVGAIEQHGPHLPVGTDRMLVAHVAAAAAEQAGATIPIIVAPVLPFGSSHHHLPFGGTISLATETYYRALCDMIESLVTSGFQRIFLLNGHGGNSELIQLVARDLALRHRVHIAAAPYWSIAWQALVAAGALQGAPVPGHAGTFETSLMLALHPDLVREPLPQRADQPDGSTLGFEPYRSELHGAWQRMDGYTDSPQQASAKRGRQMLRVIVPLVDHAVIAF